MTTLQEKLAALHARAKEKPPEKKGGDYSVNDEAYAKLKKKCPEMYHYIIYEAPYPYCPVQMLRSIELLGVDYTAKRIAESLRNDVVRLYGRNFPR